MLKNEQMIIYIFVLTLTISKQEKRSSAEKLIINTENGYVRGRKLDLDENYEEINSLSTKIIKHRLHAWLGIPFAEKPIGNLRFQRPVPANKWNGVLDTVRWPNSCYQLPDMMIKGFDGVEMWNPNTNISEDCLYLNIWAPAIRSPSTPVLVWIYGGGFYSGTSTLKIYDPRIIVSETNLIFVSIQYRVSIFGFLYLNHENAPGNQGLLDQYLALKWVYNNIQYFGGDNSKITIFGESAGSVSVSLHLLSRLSSNLFNNAILQSGTALADWALLEGIEAFKRNKELVASFGCNGSVDEIIDCILKIEPQYAIEKSDEHFYTKASHGVAQFTFLPVVDHYFLEENPLNLLNRGHFKKCPILLGANKDEGNWFFVYAFPEYRNLNSSPNISYELFTDMIKSLFYFYPQYPSTSSIKIINSIIYRYTNWNNVHNDKTNFENLDDAAGDFHFLCPVIDFANVYALNNLDVYLYYYTQRSSQHHWPEWLGVMHGDEIMFVFGEPFYPKLNYTNREKILSKKIITYWSNFVRYSNPNGDNKLAESNSSYNPELEYWPEYKIERNFINDTLRAHLNLNSNKISVGYNLRIEYCTFWGSFIPSFFLSQRKCVCSSSDSATSEKNLTNTLYSWWILFIIYIN